MSSFEQRREIVRGESMRLKVFLMSRLPPWRWPVMLANGGIRVEVGGVAVKNLTLDYQLCQGEVVVIDDAYGSTYIELRKAATSDWRDYVFCPQRVENKKEDPYLMNQVKALLLDKRVQDTPPDIRHLYALVERLVSIADHPIRRLYFACHASPYAEVIVPMREDKSTKDHEDFNARAITMESLDEAIAAKALTLDGRSSFPVTLPRPENAKGLSEPFALIIRGCSSGTHTRLLERIQKAFGDQVHTVVMPKFLNAVDFQGRVSRTQYAALVEYFQHEFTVTSKAPLKRSEVIDAFRKAKLTDWLGKPVPDSEWETTVAKVVDQDDVPTAEISARVDGRDRPVKLRAHYKGVLMLSKTWEMKQEKEPTQDEMRSFMLERWMALPAFQDPVWPYWERMGLRSVAAFALYWQFRLEVAPGKKPPKGVWPIEGVRYVYEVRTPLLDNGTLIAHYHPAGEKGKETNLIDYNDDRIFGRFKKIPKDHAQKL